MTKDSRLLFVIGILLAACGHAAHPADTASGPGPEARLAEVDAAVPAVDAAPDAAVALAPEAGPAAAPSSPSASPASGPVFDVQGPTYPAASLREVFQKNQAKLVACFEAGRKRDAKLRGHVNVKFTIGHDGKASAVQDQGSNLPDSQVVACVIKVVKGLRYGKPEGSVTVVYPFIFHSTEPLLILPDSAAPPSP
jgi:hypothetical protein